MGHFDGIPLDILLTSRGWDVTDRGCWNWRRGSRLSYGGRPQEVSRLAYKAWVDGQFGEKDRIRHLCRNKKCINPEHLRLIQPGDKRGAYCGLHQRIAEDYETGWYSISDLAGMHRIPASRIEKALSKGGKR